MSKAANIVALFNPFPHSTIVDIGCGDGAVLKELEALNFGDSLYGLETFSERTRIHYRVSHFANIQLVVLDVLGREVTVLVPEPKDAGEYSVMLDGGDLPSGVYFYKIQIDHATAIRKMVLQK
ncbi:MAG: T9SS type A sorting domain-containing protein [Bacteroidetes bacterium]|nr:T9SS type A sorting domain-containing protein [Bacteroidota bacterium]